MRFGVIRALCGMAIFFLAGSLWAEVSFSFEDLFGFGGGSGSANKVVRTANGLMVTGQAFEKGNGAITAFVWKPGTGLVRLPYLSRRYPSCAGADINQNGIVVGSCISDTYPVIHAILWEPSKRLHDLTPECPWDCEAHAVNSTGVAAGFWRHPGSRLDEAVRWNEQGMFFLGTIGEHSVAYDIADNGRIVGESQIAGSGEPPAVTYTSRGPKILGTIGGLGSGAIAINERGFVAGGADLPSGQGRPFLYDPFRRSMRPIAAPENADWAIALDINESNQVVGQFTHFNGVQLVYHAFYWQPGMPRFMDLNDLVRLPAGWELFDARGLSDRLPGTNLPCIVGTVNLPDGTSRPYLLRPSKSSNNQ